MKIENLTKIKYNKFFKYICLGLSIILIFSGCSKSKGSSEGTEGGQRTTLTTPLVTEAPGETVYSGESCTIDASNTNKGYVMIDYTGNSGKVQIQITNPNGEVYPYPLNIGSFRAFPLTGGGGAYNIDVLENISGDMYSIILSQKIDVTLDNEFDAFLYPNQYVDYNENSKAVSKGIEISNKSSSDLNYVSNVYDFVITNISYDTAFASNAPVNYIPDPDTTLSSKKGICFDYASLMSSMLRSQGIPTKLVVGYSGEAYHAWISVYSAETGWIENIIEFDGKSWVLMDPTLAASNDPAAVEKYIGNGSNYTAKYTY